MTKQEQFFYDNAGYSYDAKVETAEQGRERCAKSLAQAETYARDENWRYDWDQDRDACIGCDCGSGECACSTGEPHETLTCVLRDEHAHVLASLGGICEPTAKYQRVVEAELALEAMPRTVVA